MAITRGQKPCRKVIVVYFALPLGSERFVSNSLVNVIEFRISSLCFFLANATSRYKDWASKCRSRNLSEPGYTTAIMLFMSMSTAVESICVLTDVLVSS